jgi:hypothetical protein
MRRLARIPRLLKLLCIVALVGLGFYEIQQTQQKKLQTQILGRSIERIEPADSIVLLTPSPRGMPMQVRDSRPDSPNPKYSPFDKLRAFDLGDRFRIGDEHFSVDYELRSIDTDGIIIHYSSNGGPPSPIRRASGNIKLLWK